MLRSFSSKLCMGLAAGIMISIGGCVYLASDNKYVGATFFAVALLSICLKGYSLYTGKICYIPEDHSADAISTLLVGLLGNIIATFLCGAVIRYAVPNIGSAAEAVCAAKLASQSLPQTVLRAVFCGVLVYLAVAIWREKNRVVGIIFCIPTFILCGFEHSIADMFYFGASGAQVWLRADAMVFLLAVLIGNSLGGVLLPLLGMVGNTKKMEKKSNEQ